MRKFITLFLLCPLIATAQGVRQSGWTATTNATTARTALGAPGTNYVDTTATNMATIAYNAAIQYAIANLSGPTNGASVGFVTNTFSGMVTTITNGLATTNYVNTAVQNGTNNLLTTANSNIQSATNNALQTVTNGFYLKSNPSNFVTAAITNGLSSTNYANSTVQSATNNLLNTSSNLFLNRSVFTNHVLITGGSGGFASVNHFYWNGTLGCYADSTLVYQYSFDGSQTWALSSNSVVYCRKQNSVTPFHITGDIIYGSFVADFKETTNWGSASLVNVDYFDVAGAAQSATNNLLGTITNIANSSSLAATNEFVSIMNAAILAATNAIPAGVSVSDLNTASNGAISAAESYTTEATNAFGNTVAVTLTNDLNSFTGVHIGDGAGLSNVTSTATNVYVFTALQPITTSVKYTFPHGLNHTPYFYEVQLYCTNQDDGVGYVTNGIVKISETIHSGQTYQEWCDATNVYLRVYGNLIDNWSSLYFLPKDSGPPSNPDNPANWNLRAVAF